MKKLFKLFAIIIVIILAFNFNSIYSKVSKYLTSNVTTKVTEKVNTMKDNLKDLSDKQLNKIKNTCNNVTTRSNATFKVKGLKNVKGTDVIYLNDVDGDTIDVDMNNIKTKIRFLMIDTPETVKPNTPLMPYGVQAKEYVKSHLHKGEHIKIVPGKDKTDKYGRSLGYIYYYKDGGWYSLNEELVAEGLARIAYVYDKKDSHLNNLYKAEESAKAQKLNIWSIKNYVTNRGYNLNAVS